MKDALLHTKIQNPVIATDIVPRDRLLAQLEQGRLRQEHPGWLLAIQFKRLAYRLWLILSFSLGLAFVLVVIGIVVVRAAGVVRKSAGEGAALAALPVFSSVMVTILGLALLVGTFVQYGFLVIRP